MATPRTAPTIPERRQPLTPTPASPRGMGSDGVRPPRRATLAYQLSGALAVVAALGSAVGVFVLALIGLVPSAIYLGPPSPVSHR